MADGFVVGNGRSGRGEDTRFALDRTAGATGGTGLFLGEGLGLLLQGGRQGTLSQTGGRSVGNLLHGVEVNIEARAILTKGAAGNNFTPAGGKVTDLLQLFRGKFASWHGLSCLVVAKKL
jgi:hypothetical protein